MAATDEKFVSQEECDGFARQMQIKYAGFLNQRTFDISVNRDQHAIFVKAILRNQSSSFYYPVEGRVLKKQRGRTDRELLDFLIDYIDLYFEDYLKEEVFLPIDWADYQYDDVEFQLKGQILNLEAEKIADEFLKKRS